MNSLQDTELLCSLAEQYDWENLKTQLKIILEKNKRNDTATLAIDYVELYSLRFIQLHPNEIWVDERIKEIREFIFTTTTQEIQPSLFPERDRKYADPMARTFHSAMASLWSMARWKDKKLVFTEYATDTISIMITILRLESPIWHPKALDVLYENPGNTREVGKMLWLDLGQKLKILL